MPPPERIALILDHPKRDLDGLVLVALHLLQRGRSVLITPMYQQGYDLPLLAPSVVLVNYARRNNKELLETYKELGIRVAVLDTEGGVLSEDGADSPERWAKTFYQDGFFQVVDQYFFWGPELYQAFYSGSGLPPDTLRISGCPRYDVCLPPWRGILTYPWRDYVLVNTNFSAINPAFTQSDEKEKEIFYKLGWEPSYVEQLFADMKAVFPHYLEQIERLAIDNPERCFIVRPHPFENQRFYHRRFAGIRNLIVSGEGNVLHAIANANCLIHLNCGTSVECNLLGKVPLSMEFLNTEILRRHSPLPSEISCRAESYADLNRLIRDTQAREARHQAAEVCTTHLARWFGPLDGQAAARVAEGLIEMSCGRTDSAQWSWTVSLRASRQQTNLRRFTFGLFGNMLGTAVTTCAGYVFERARWAKAVTVHDVFARIQAFMQLAGIALPIKCRRAKHPYTGFPMASIELVLGS